MKIRCKDNTNMLVPGRLVVGKIYEIDPLRDIEINVNGVAALYVIDGKFYGSWRFESAEPVISA